MLVISGLKFCCKYGTLTEPSRGDFAPSAFSVAFHWMNLAFGLGLAPSASTGCHSDQVLSGTLVFPLLVNTSIRRLSSDLHESLPHDETASVSLTVDSYVPDIASASPTRKSFPIFADVAYSRFPTAINRVVCSSVDSRSHVVYFGPSSV